MNNTEETRTILLNNEKIEYLLIKTKIKNIYISIKDKKITVRAPIKISLKEIENILLKKEKWILKKIREDILVIERKSKYTNETFKKIVLKYVDKYSRLIGVHPNKISIKQLKYAWGSCTSNRNISINYELIKYEEYIIEYVIVHELCHLRYMNHSKKFWELVEEYIPNYKECRKMLKK